MSGSSRIWSNRPATRPWSVLKMFPEKELEMTTKPITMILAGGLGNQLFQWATGYALSQRLHTGLELDSRKIVRLDKSLDQRSYQLNYFSISNYQSLPLGTRMKLPSLIWGASKSRAQTFQESSFRFDQRIEDVGPGSTLTGHFQSWRYFDGYESEIREALALGAKPSPEYLDLRRKLAGRRWVGVHVRRGDYENFPEIFTLLDANYYARSLNSLDLSASDEVVVFSENIADARALVPQGTIYADSSKISEPGDVVMLLAGANHVVGANSSLSWWGAYLNETPDAEKIFPSRWFGPKGWPIDDLIPTSWRLT